jgi:hypothetical protein
MNEVQVRVVGWTSEFSWTITAYGFPFAGAAFFSSFPVHAPISTLALLIIRRAELHPNVCPASRGEAPDQAGVDRSDR